MDAMRRSKIVATIGPASDDPETLVRMIEAGMDVARLNFAHGSPDEKAATAERVRAAAERVGKPVAILQDLPGPKLRIGELATTSRSSSRATRSRSSAAPRSAASRGECPSAGAASRPRSTSAR